MAVMRLMMIVVERCGSGGSVGLGLVWQGESQNGAEVFWCWALVSSARVSRVQLGCGYGT